MTDVTPFLRDKGDCQGNQDRCTAQGCPIFGMLRQGRDGKGRPKGCLDPVGRGQVNKKKGGRGQAKALTALGRPTSTLRPGHEETIGGALRIEVKSGDQVSPIWTRYLQAKAQSEASRSIGDHRPFVMAAMKGDKGLLVMEIDGCDQTVAALAEALGMVP